MPQQLQGRLNHDSLKENLLKYPSLCSNGSAILPADGGKYAEASLAAHRANLVALHTYVSQQQTQQQAQLTALHAELAGSIQSAQDAVEALLPSHKQDMALVELLAQKVEGARKKAAAQLSANTQAAEGIDQLLTELQGCLGKAAPAGRPAPASTGAAADAAKAECQQLMVCAGKLGQQLLRQSQVRLTSLLLGPSCI